MKDMALYREEPYEEKRRSPTNNRPIHEFRAPEGESDRVEFNRGAWQSPSSPVAFWQLVVLTPAGSGRLT